MPVNMQMKPCPKCGEPGGAILCPVCHSNRSPWGVLKGKSPETVYGPQQEKLPLKD